MRPVSTAVRQDSRSKQRPRQTTPYVYPSQSTLIESFVNMRNTVQDVQRRNKQFMQSIKSNEISRSKRASSRSREKQRQRKPHNDLIQTSVTTSKSNIGLELQVQRLNNKLIQEKRSKQLLEQQLLLVESRCAREKSKIEKIDKEYQNKVNSVKMNVAKQLSEFSENVRDMFWRIDKKNNRNKELLDDLNLVLKQENKYKKYRSKSRSFNTSKKLEQPFKKKVVDDNNKHILEIGQKYQQLFLNKNEELQKLHESTKAKDKEIRQLKMLVDKLHCKQKQQQLKNRTLVEELQLKISTLEKKQDLSLSLKKKQSIDSSSNSHSTSKIRQRQLTLQTEISNLKSQLKQKSSSLIEFTSKVTNLQKLLSQRSNTIQMIQKDMYNQKLNKTQLLTEYQSAIERNKSQYKSKLQHILLQTEELKSTIVRKDTQLKQVQESQSVLLNKVSEMEAEVLVLNQKLVLRQELYLKPIEFKQDSMTISRNSSILVTQQQDQQSQNLRKQNRLLLLQKEQIKIQINRLQESKKKLDLQLHIQISKRQQQQQINKSLKTQILQLQQQILSISKQQNLIPISNTKSIEQFEIQTKIMQSRNQQLEKQNVQTNSQLIRYQHDLKLSMDLQNILENKLVSVKNIVDEGERKIGKLEEEIGSLNKIISLQREEISELKFQEGYKNQNYQQELFCKSIEIEKLNSKLTEMAQLHKQTDENNDIRIKLQLKNNNLQQDVEQLNKQLSKIKLQYGCELAKLKEKQQTLVMKNIENQQTIKFQSIKINEIEDKMWREEGNITYQQQITELNNKIKSLQHTILEFEISKANHQRQLQQSEKLRQTIKQQNLKLLSQVQKTKAECNNLLFLNQQKLQQQDKIIRVLQSNIKQKCGDTSGSKKSIDKSGISNSFLSLDIDMSMDQNYDVLDKLPYAFEKLHLKRKSHVKMMEKITEYIQNLKSKIAEQNKIIKINSKRIEAFRNGDFTDKLEDDNEDKGDNDDRQLRRFEVTSLKQVSINRKYTRRIRALECQKQLLLEQTNIFQRQVSALQDELLRADEQQKNYIRMKQIYKQQISRQRKAIEQKNQIIKKHTEEKSMVINNNVEDSGQVFVKIMTIVFGTQYFTYYLDEHLSQRRVRWKSTFGLFAAYCLLMVQQLIG